MSLTRSASPTSVSGAAQGCTSRSGMIMSYFSGGNLGRPAQSDISMGSPPVIDDPVVQTLFEDTNVDNKNDYAMIDRMVRSDKVVSPEALTALPPFDVQAMTKDADHILKKVDSRRQSEDMTAHRGRSGSVSKGSSSRRGSRSRRGSNADRESNCMSSATYSDPRSLSSSASHFRRPSVVKKGAGKGKKSMDKSLDRKHRKGQDKSVGIEMPPPKPSPPNVQQSPTCSVCEHHAYVENLEFETCATYGDYMVNYCHSDTSVAKKATSTPWDDQGGRPTGNSPSSKSLSTKEMVKRDYRKKSENFGHKRRTSVCVEETATSEAIELLRGNLSRQTDTCLPTSMPAALAPTGPRASVRQYRYAESRRPVSVLAGQLRWPQFSPPFSPHPLSPVHSPQLYGGEAPFLPSFSVPPAATWGPCDARPQAWWQETAMPNQPPFPSTAQETSREQVPREPSTDGRQSDPWDDGAQMYSEPVGQTYSWYAPLLQPQQGGGSFPPVGAQPRAPTAGVGQPAEYYDYNHTDTSSNKFLSYRNDTPAIDGNLVQPARQLALPVCKGTSMTLDASPLTLSRHADVSSDRPAPCCELAAAKAPNGNAWEVKVTYICTPDHWYGQLISMLKHLSKVCRIISSSRSESACCERDVKKGSYWIYRDIPHETGARVRVEEVLDLGKSRNFLIDYGNRKVISSSCLFRMDKRLYSISPIALRFQLVGIRPWSEWTDTAVTAFERFTLDDSPLTVEVLDTQSCGGEFGDKVHLVKLFSETYGNVAERMIRDGYARMPAPAGKRERKTRPVQNVNSGDMQLFDPMQDDYSGLLNSYGVNTDDPGVATSNFALKNGQRVCKFFSANGTCKQGQNCVYSHIAEEANSALLHINEPVLSLLRRTRPPRVGSMVFGQVSACSSPHFFYLIFPYGRNSVEQLIVEDMDFEPMRCFESLMEELQRECSLRKFSENRLYIKSKGELVAARSNRDKRWYRGQIVSNGHDDIVQVFFVDFGFCEWLPIKEVKTLNDCFAHVPFQAHSACIVTDGFGFLRDKTGGDAQIREVFLDCVTRKDLLVGVDHISEGLLHVRLYFIKNDTLFNVVDCMKAHKKC